MGGAGGSPVRRVMIMGPPGSGKSTLARALGRRLDLPVVHLDQLFWRPGWVEAAADEFRAEVDRAAGLSAWIIEGNFASTVGSRLAAADAFIYLDVPTWLSLLRVTRRVATSYGRVRADLAAGCPERFDPAFLRFVATWNRKSRARHLALFESFPGRKALLRPGDDPPF